MAPPAALAGEGRLFELTQDTLRGATLAALPFFDRAKVVALLDALPTLDEASRTAYDPALMILLSACALQMGYGLSDDGRESGDGTA
jgi:asparagine synthase (glutamine-hydrolysing)